MRLWHSGENELPEAAYHVLAQNYQRTDQPKDNEIMKGLSMSAGWRIFHLDGSVLKLLRVIAIFNLENLLKYCNLQQNRRFWKKWLIDASMRKIHLIVITFCESSVQFMDDVFSCWTFQEFTIKVFPLRLAQHGRSENILTIHRHCITTNY